MADIHILFGEMGGGKNHWGRQLALAVGGLFFDGDDALPLDMWERVENFESLPRQMVQSFTRAILPRAIEARADPRKVLYVAQALYMNSDRLYLQSTLERLGHTVEFYWVRPSLWRNFRQLLSRPKGWRWVLYWLLRKPFFQKPTHPYHLLRS